MLRESTFKRTLDAAFCAQKRALPTQAAAEALARQHFACSVCSTTGRKMGAYVCPAAAPDELHYHIGHQHP
jgi:hypothetical protein